MARVITTLPPSHRISSSRLMIRRSLVDWLGKVIKSNKKEFKQSMNNASLPPMSVAANSSETNGSTASSPMSPPPMAKSPLSSSLSGMTGVMMSNHAQPNSPSGYAPGEVEVPVSAQSTSPEEAKEPLDSSKGRLIENEKVLEYGGPNNRYGKVSPVMSFIFS